MILGRHLAVALVLAPAALLGAGCSQKQVDTTSSAAKKPAASKTATSPRAQAPSAAVGRPKPAVAVPAGKPPTRLVVKDLIKGTGLAAKPGDQVTVNYVGKAYSTKKEFDNSYDRGQPFPFQLGGGQVIPGWDRGLVGMKVGGRRELIIPPALAYGSQGSPPAIKPNETLVFVIDLLARR